MSVRPPDWVDPNPYDPPERLYGAPGAEDLYGGLDSAADAFDYETYPVVLEEWTVRDVAVSDRTLDLLLEWLAEAETEEGDEGYAEAWYNAIGKPDVRRAARIMVDLAASYVGYRMADRHVATWHAYPDDGSWRFEKVEAKHD